jgi:fumarate hydratase class II
MQVMGNDTTIGVAAGHGTLELNTYKPLIIHAFLHSVRLLGDAAVSFDQHCARGIQPNAARIAAHVEASLMLVTALSPHLGYDIASSIAHHAHDHGLTLREAALALGALDGPTFDRLVVPAAMVLPGGNGPTG